MKGLLVILIIGYCSMTSEGILLALKAKLLGYKAGKAVGIAAGLGKGALIGGIGQQSGYSNRVIRYYTNPIYSYDPRPIPPYGHGIGGGYIQGGGGPIVKVLHKHLPQPPQVVNVFHHSDQHYGGSGGGGGIGPEYGHDVGGAIGGGGAGVHIVKLIHEDSSLYGNSLHDDIGHHYQPEQHVEVIKVIQENDHNVGPIGHGWS